MKDNKVDKNDLIGSLKEKIEQRKYELFDLFMKDLKDLESNDRYREFIFVSHNYLSEIIDTIILNYFISLEKRKEFENYFDIQRLPFSKKIGIVKESNLVPKELCRILSDFNKIRNKVAHYVNWLEELDKLNNLIIKKDKNILYNSVPIWIMFLGLYLEFSKRSKKERKKLDRDMQISAKAFGMSLEELFRAQ